MTVNGVSLTVCNPTADTFSVAIIPYTHDNTNFCDIAVGSTVNIEFDILGKYIARLTALTAEGHISDRRMMLRCPQSGTFTTAK